MDSKGSQEEITYPNIVFTVDNFEEVNTVNYIFRKILCYGRR